MTMETLVGIRDFFGRAWQQINPLLAWGWAGICWVLFPDAAYIPAAVATGGAIVMDIITKFIAISRSAGGYFKAIRAGAISSDVLWQRTKDKLIWYLCVVILVGLAARVTMLRVFGITVSTVVYSVVFIREFQSNLENLRDAGCPWAGPLVDWTKRKEDAVLNDDSGGTDK